MGCTAISAQGTKFEIGGTGSPTAFTEIGGVKTWNGFDGQAQEIDTSCLQSTEKEFILGLPDPGNLQLDININDDDAGQIALQQARADQTLRNFRITLRNGKIRNFQGYVRSTPEQGGVDQAVVGSVGIRISGPVVRSS